MPMLHTFKPSRAPVKRVNGVQFCVWDPEDIVRAPLLTFTPLSPLARSQTGPPWALGNCNGN